MMERVSLQRLILICMMFWVGVQAQCIAALSSEESPKNIFKYSKDILTKELNLKYKEFYLDEDVYRNAKEDLSDIRIVNNNGENIPYYIQSGLTVLETKSEVYNAALINQFKKKKDTFYDFKVENILKDTDVRANSLKFFAANTNFAKEITVYGSYDNIHWDEVVTDKIYKVDNISKDEILFQKIEKYQYYRLKVPNNLEELSISKLELQYGEREEHRSSLQKTVELKNETKNNANETIIKVYNPNALKINEIHIDVDGNFKRRYSVYRGSAETASNLIQTGEICNLNFRDLNINNSNISFINKPINAETIIIKIDNKDDKPINIKVISGKYYLDKLVFEGSNKNSYKLLFGNGDAQKPKYDIELYKNEVDKEKHEVCVLSNLQTQIVPSSPVQTSFLQMYSKQIFNGSVILAAIVLIIIIGFKLKKQG